MLNVFVSRPTWVAKEFREGLAALSRVLGSHDLVPRTLGVTDYPRKSPMDEVIALLDECAGAVILGIPQLEVQKGTLKGEPLNAAIQLSTEWNHIEAGLACARGLPLLVIHNIGVSRGVFDHGAVGAFVYGVDLTRPAWPIEPEISGALQKWKRDCMAGRPARARKTKKTKKPRGRRR